MKTEFGRFGNFEFIPETAQDIVWLEMFTRSLNGVKQLAKHFTWDLEEDAEKPMRKIEIHEVLDTDGDVCGRIEKISFKMFNF